MQDTTNGVSGTCYFPGANSTAESAALDRTGGPVDVEVLCKSGASTASMLDERQLGPYSCEHCRNLPLIPAVECDMVPGYLFVPGSYIDVNKFPGIRLMGGAEPLRMSRQ